MINIKKTIREIKVAPPTEEVKTYIDSKGQEHDTLFGAIKANHDIINTPLSSYFEKNWETRFNYEKQVKFTELYHQDIKDLYLAFVCSSEDDAEVAMLLTGDYYGLDMTWSVPGSTYALVRLETAFCDILNQIHENGSVAYYFCYDDQGDSPDFYFGDLNQIEQDLREDKELMEKRLKKVSELVSCAQIKGYSIKQEECGHNWAKSSFSWTSDKTAHEIERGVYGVAKMLHVAYQIYWDYQEIEKGSMAGGIIATTPIPVVVYFYQDEAKDEVRMSVGDTVYCDQDRLELWRDGTLVQQWSPLREVY